MSNEKLDPRSLTSEERALWDQLAMRALGNGCYAYECFAITEGVFRELLKKRRAIFGEPASEPAKVECKHSMDAYTGACAFCGIEEPAQPEPVAHEDAEFLRAGALAMARIIERDEQPEPVAEEMQPMPKEVHALVLWSQMLASSRYGSEFKESITSDIAAFTDWWRTHATQPAKVRMTEELEAVLRFAEETTEMRGPYASDAWFWNSPFLDEIAAKIAAVRAQAAEAADASAVYDKGFADGIALQKKCGADAGKVRMPKVRIALNTMKTHFEPNCQGQCEFPMVWNICRFGIEELDAHEGKGEGRG